MTIIKPNHKYSHLLLIEFADDWHGIRRGFVREDDNLKVLPHLLEEVLRPRPLVQRPALLSRPVLGD